LIDFGGFLAALKGNVKEIMPEYAKFGKYYAELVIAVMKNCGDQIKVAQLEGLFAELNEVIEKKLGEIVHGQ